MAATVVDAFLVTLGLDGINFTRGMADATKAKKKFADETAKEAKEREKLEKKAADAEAKRKKEAEAANKRAVDGYKRVRNELVLMAAVFTAGVGIKDFISDTINGAVNLGYLSDNLKMSTQQLTAYQRASERAGGTAGGMIAQLKESQDTLARFRSGMGPNEGLQAFFRWGGNPEDLKDGNTYLMARSRIIHEMFKVDPAKAALIAKEMGTSEEQFNFLKQGPALMAAQIKEQEKYAAVTKKDTEAAKAMQTQMLNLRDSLTTTATKIILQLAPALTELAKKLEQGAQWVISNRDVIAKWVDSAVGGIKKFLIEADKFATAVGGWQNVLMGIAAVPIVSALASIAIAVGGIVAAGAGIPALVAALSVVAAYSGYGAAKALDKKFGSGPGRDARMHADIMSGGTGMGEKMSKEELKAEAARQRAGGQSRTSWSGNITPLGSELAAGGGGSRGIRNNNPGNIEYGAFTKGKGAIGSDGRFAKFSTPEAGISAMSDLLRSYGSRGINTVGSIVSKYAPGHENNTAAYIESVSKKLGVSGTATLDMNDPAVMEKLVSAMIQHENGKNPYSNDMLKRATMSQSQRQANAAAVGGMPAGAAASAAGGKAAGATVTNNSRFDAINVYTAATDAEGIAKAMRPALEKNSVAAQANTGFQ